MSENNPLITNQELIISNMLEIQAIIRILTRKGITNDDEILDEVRKVQAEMEQKLRDSTKLN